MSSEKQSFRISIVLTWIAFLFLVSSSQASNLDSIPFVPAGDFGSGRFPNSICAADLDRDGDLDLALTSRDSWTVSVLMNHGDGSYTLKNSYVTGDTPRHVIASDLDNDGDLDLAVANSGFIPFSQDSTVSIFRNDGGGDFEPKVDYIAGFGPFSLAAADLDRDDDIDLAVANFISGTISLLKNNGEGIFGAKVDYVSGHSPHWITAQNLDSDSCPDLATVNFGDPYSAGGSSLSILKNEGDGTFPNKVDYETGWNPNAVWASDLDNDGDLDLAVSNSSSLTLSVYLNNGDGSFASKVDYPTGYVPGSVTAADLDLDGDEDLVVANFGDTGSPGNTISLFKNFGDGTFSPKIDYQTPQFPLAIISRDFDRDGDWDLGVTSLQKHAVTVFKNLLINSCQALPGDANGDGKILLSDIVTINNFIFKNQPAPTPPCSGDPTADGIIYFSDVIYLLNFIFKSGPAPKISGSCCWE